MRIYCKISGEEFFSSDDFKEESIFPDVHPIFRLPARLLLAKAKRYGKAKFSDKEEKLLLLALLNTTNAMVWEVPAVPDNQVVKKNLEQVFKLVAWFIEVQGGSLKLPTYRVSSTTCTLTNINIFIQTWYEVRKEWMAPSIRKLQQDLLEQREYTLHKLIHSQKMPEQYAARLASWAMDAANVHSDRREEWTELLLMKPDKNLFSCSLDELLDLQDWMQRELYTIGSHSSSASGTIYSAKVLEHIHNLVTLRKEGILGLLRNEVGGIGNTFQIRMTNSATENSQAPEQLLELYLQEKLELEQRLSGHNITYPFNEPKKELFSNRLSDWIKARANWILTEQLREDYYYLIDRINSHQSSSLSSQQSHSN